MFGVDCGARTDGAVKHAKDSPYVTDDTWAKRDADYRYPLEAPGNFGGIARTDWLMDLSRRLLGQIIQVRQLKVYNCSDGAQIARAVPQVPANVRLDGPVLNRAAIKATLRGRVKHYAPGEFLADFDLAAFAADARRMFDACAAMLDETEKEAGDLVAVYDLFAKFFETRKDDWSATSALVTASTITFVKIAMFFAHRMPEDADRDALRAVFFAETRKIHAHMREESLALLDRLAAEQAARPALVDAN
jgi:hypothetical protein